MQRDKIQSKKIQMKENKRIPKNRLDITQSSIIHMNQNTKMIIYKKDKIQNDKNKDSMPVTTNETYFTSAVRACA